MIGHWAFSVARPTALELKDPSCTDETFQVAENISVHAVLVSPTH